MLGATVRRANGPAGDPIANLEKMIKENSEVQAGNFQLQHEMQLVISQRTSLLADLSGLADKEKELIVFVTERYNKVQQHHNLLKWVSEKLNRINMERSHKRTMLTEIERDIEQSAKSIFDVEQTISTAIVSLDEIRFSRESTLISYQSLIEDIAHSLETAEQIRRMYNGKYDASLKLASRIGTETEGIDILETIVQDIVFSNYRFGSSFHDLIEQLESNGDVTFAQADLETAYDEFAEVEKQLEMWQTQIFRYEHLDKLLNAKKHALEELGRSLKLTQENLYKSSQLYVAAVEVHAELEIQTALLNQELQGLEAEAYSLQCSNIKEITKLQQCDDIIGSALFQQQKWEETSRKTIDKLVDMRKRSQKIDGDLTESREHFTVIIGNPLTECCEDVTRLKWQLRRCRNTLKLLIEDDASLEHRNDMLEVVQAYRDVQNPGKSDPGTKGHGNLLFSASPKVLHEMDEETTRISSKLEEQECISQELSTDLFVLYENQQLKRNEVLLQKDVEASLQQQLDCCLIEIAGQKRQHASEVTQMCQLYEKEIQISPHDCEIGQIPKDIVSQMNFKKLHQNREFNCRLDEIQTKIDKLMDISRSAAMNDMK